MNGNPSKKNEHGTEHHFYFDRYFVLDQEKRIYVPESPEGSQPKTNKKVSPR